MLPLFFAGLLIRQWLAGVEKIIESIQFFLPILDPAATVAITMHHYPLHQSFLPNQSPGVIFAFLFISISIGAIIIQITSTY